MLVLSRKPNEAITIGEDIKISVLSIDSDRVKLGIEAPRDMRVYRYETVKKVVAKNREAASANVNMVGLAHLRDAATHHEEAKNSDGACSVENVVVTVEETTGE